MGNLHTDNSLHSPWYQRTLRWGQTNLSEQDPLDYDPAFWIEQWKRTHIQGVIVNAGGIVAYYPSQFKLHHRAQFLGERDLFGEICATARSQGLAVLARMDSNRANRDFFEAYPDWFTTDADGNPGMAGELYIACLNSPYTQEYLPEVLREIIFRYRPDGFTDNSWTGPGRNWICHCRYCQLKFHSETGLDLPNKKDWDEPVYRQWVRWSYACRTEIWELNNQITRIAGGQDCLWLGMINGDPFHSHLTFCDLKVIGEKTEILMSDQQGRGRMGFKQNAQSGKLLHGVLGWNRLIPESMAMYVRGEQAFRKASNPPLEVQKWMVSGFAGGISPWWHHVGAQQEDHRQFNTAQSLMAWHAENESFLYNRQPVANVGVVWSHENADFYGCGQVEQRVGDPWHGITLALTKARLPYLPVHADHISRDGNDFGLKLLILPDLAVMSVSQCEAVRSFVQSGGSLLASGCTSLLDIDGQPRSDFYLADFFGVHHSGNSSGAENSSSSWDSPTTHNYLRLPAIRSNRHHILRFFDETNILPFGGMLQNVYLPTSKDENSDVLATYIPSFPIYPPETSWMRQPGSDLPAIVVREYPSGGRVVYFAADIDRCYGRRKLPDHGQLLCNAIQWALCENSTLEVKGPGLIDCHLYQQPDRLILHLINLSGCEGSTYLEEHLPVGPIQITLKQRNGIRPKRAVCRVSGEVLPLTTNDEWACIELNQLVDHEVIIVE